MTARLKIYSWEGDFFTVLVSSGQRWLLGRAEELLLFYFAIDSLNSSRECNPQSIKRQFADRFSEKWQTEVVLGCFFFSSLVCIWELHDSKANWVLTMGQSDHKIFIMDSIGLFVPSWFSCIGWLELQKKPLLNFKNYCFVLYYSLYARNATLWAWILPRWPACKQDNPFLGSVEGLQNRNKQTPDGSPFHFIINLVVIYSYLTAQSKTLNIKRWLNRKRLNKKIHDSHEGC